MVKRIPALLRISRPESAAVIRQEVAGWVARVDDWFKKLGYDGVNRLAVRWRGGRRRPLSKTQQAGWGALLKAGPLAAGLTSAC